MNITYETINILLLLVPGFIATRIIDAITQRREQNDVGRLVEALIFSFLIYAIVNLFTDWQPIFRAVTSGEVTTYKFSTDHILLMTIAIFTALVPITIGVILHYDLFMKVLRFLRITDKTWRDSLWQDVFIEQKRFLVINLKDERRIYGWPMYYSNDPKEGFIYLYNPAWIDEDGKYVECGTHGILIQMENIDSIEFIKEDSERNLPDSGGENEPKA